MQRLAAEAGSLLFAFGRRSTLPSCAQLAACEQQSRCSLTLAPPAWQAARSLTTAQASSDAAASQPGVSSSKGGPGMTEQESWAGPTLTAYQRQRVEAILATRAEQRRKTLCDPICNPHGLICMWRHPALRCDTSLHTIRRSVLNLRWRCRPPALGKVLM